MEDWIIGYWICINENINRWHRSLKPQNQLSSNTIHHLISLRMDSRNSKSRNFLKNRLSVDFRRLKLPLEFQLSIDLSKYDLWQFFFFYPSYCIFNQKVDQNSKIMTDLIFSIFVQSDKHYLEESQFAPLESLLRLRFHQIWVTIVLVFWKFDASWKANDTTYGNDSKLDSKLGMSFSKLIFHLRNRSHNLLLEYSILNSVFRSINFATLQLKLL